MTNNFSHYFGLNHSPLDIYGKISCFVIMNKVKFNFELLIVANKSMAYITVLGRDFMNICNFKIVRENDCSNDSCADDRSNDSCADDR